MSFGGPVALQGTPSARACWVRARGATQQALGPQPSHDAAGSRERRPTPRASGARRPWTHMATSGSSDGLTQSQVGRRTARRWGPGALANLPTNSRGRGACASPGRSVVPELGLRHLLGQGGRILLEISSRLCCRIRARLGGTPAGFIPKVVSMSPDSWTLAAGGPMLTSIGLASAQSAGTAWQSSFPISAPIRPRFERVLPDSGRARPTSPRNPRIGPGSTTLWRLRLVSDAC